MNRNSLIFRYVISRITLAPLMIWIISSLVFVLLRIAPGDPVDAILGNKANETAKELMRSRLGLDQPLIKQYLNYLGELIKGNFGESLNSQEPVLNMILRALPASIELGLLALLIALTIGIIVGFSGIAKPEGKIDFSGRMFGITTYALPPFWVAMVFQFLFAVSLGWLPIGGRFPPNLIEPSGTGFLILDSILSKDWLALQGSIRHLALPAFTLGFLLSGIFSRSLRLNLGKALRGDFIEAARSRGLKQKQIILNHALPNSLLPLLTISGLTIASLVGGALLIEITFSWPGLALGLQEAINLRDYPVVQGFIVVVSSMIIFISISIDLLIAIFDPRIKY